MMTVLSEKGQIVLPARIRQELRLFPGDDFEIAIEDEQTITLRRIGRPVNHGLVDVLEACPAAFDIPARDMDDSAPPRL